MSAYKLSGLHRHILTGLSLLILVINLTAAQTSTPNGEQIRSIAWSPDGDKIAVGYQNGKIEIMSLSSPSNTRVLQEATHLSYILALAWSPDGQMLASGSAGYPDVLTIWDVNTGTPVLTNDRLWDDILSVTWSPDGTQLFTTAAEHRNGAFSSILINVSSAEMQGIPIGAVSDVQWSPNGAEIALTHVINILIFDPIALEIVAHYPLDRTQFRDNLQNQAFNVVWNPNGSEIAVGTTDGRIFVFSTIVPNELTLVNMLIAHEYNGDDRLLGFVYALSFAGNGRLLTSISGDGTVRTWDTTTWQITREQFVSPLYDAVFSPYGGRAALAIASEALHLRSSEDLLTMTDLNNSVQIVVPAPSLERLAAIAELCVRDSATRSAEVNNLTRQAPAALDDLPTFVAQVEALPDDAIPPACRADLLAMASALGE